MAASTGRRGVGGPARAQAEIPEEEVNLCWVLYLQATALAGAGRFELGLKRLHEGRRRAETAWKRGRSWGEALTERYQTTLQRFSEKYASPQSTGPG